MIKAVVKHSYLKGSKGLGKARAHINYIQYREGEDRGKGPRQFFNDEREQILGRDIKERVLEQETNGVVMHKIMLSPGVQGADLQEYTREMMERLEREKGQQLEWYAVEHRNTEHVHVHVVVMGKDEDGRRVWIDRDDHKDLRDWGNRYLEREHTLERYLDREQERLLKDKEYKYDRGDKEYERLMYGDGDDKKRSARETERDNREWEQLDKDLHKVFNRERGLEHRLTYKQFQREAAGRLEEFHSDHTGRELRERWEKLVEQEPELAKAAEKELEWLDKMQAEERQERQERGGSVDIDRLIDGLEPWERDDRRMWEQLDKEMLKELQDRKLEDREPVEGARSFGELIGLKPMEQERKEREEERGQPERGDLAERGFKVEDLFAPQIEREEQQMEQEAERGEETADRSWETFETDRQVMEEGGRDDEDREEKERDRGDDMFGR